MSTAELEQHAPYLAFIAFAVVLVVVMTVAAVLETWRPGHAPYDGHQPAAGAPGVADPDPPATSFVCPTCGAESWNPNDRRHGYCGRCKAFTGRPDGLDIPTDRRTA